MDLINKIRVSLANIHGFQMHCIQNHHRMSNFKVTFLYSLAQNPQNEQLRRFGRCGKVHRSKNGVIKFYECIPKNIML